MNAGCASVASKAPAATRRARDGSAESPLRRRLFPWVAGVYSLVMLVGPAVFVAALEAFARTPAGLAWLLLPVAYVTLLPVIAGLLSLAHRHAIVPGRFPTDVGHRIYFHRRLYGLCWTTVYYSGPIYAFVLAAPWQRRLVLWLFGYRGASDVVFYTDTWIRDLPLLDLGPGVYLSNKATIGTNIILMNREILVRPIRIGARSLVGHLVIVGTGVELGSDVEIGLATSLGVATRVDDGAHVGPCCGLEHRVSVGAGARIGARSYLGSRVVIGPGVQVPADSRIPAGTKILGEADLARLRVRAIGESVEPSWDTFLERPKHGAVE